MAMVGVDSGSLYRRTHSLSRLVWSWDGGRLAPFYIHQMNRVKSGELSQWLCHDDSTINIVLVIIIIIIIMLVDSSAILSCRLTFDTEKLSTKIAATHRLVLTGDLFSCGNIYPSQHNFCPLQIKINPLRAH